ncbi:threonine-phosphate decarboxylase CobD [Shewanella sp. KT0246]|uniref:threonine-phosphate decarboxylase CobD n=1 Tax=Shewanella sp. KT0246 TaxID=2815912 RepID=UPI001BC578ED|nr:threonine-phosphate decarboxylase CobD [Shewanella sp. KT0246]GIU48417.1 threonine-phosphate decarboxylase [Shewanella sp. KT0246]
MTLLHHGGKLNRIASKYSIPKSEWVDLSTGVSPWTYPIPEIPLSVWNRLPEEDGLEESAAHYYGGISPLAVAGSQAAIQLLPDVISHIRGQKGRILLPNIGYKEHEKSWRDCGWELDFYESRTIDSQTGKPISDPFPSSKQVEQCDVLLVINPNNPSSIEVPVALLKKWRAIVSAKQGYLIIDEAFMDVDNAKSIDKHNMDNLVVLRSIGKFFGLAGIRVGFVFAPERVKQILQNKLGPWTVNGPARYICKKAFSDIDWQQKQITRLEQASLRMRQLLTSLNVPVTGTALFQCAYFNNAQQWFDLLCQHGVLVRLTDEGDALRFGLPKNELQWSKLIYVLNSIQADMSQSNESFSTPVFEPAI